MCLSVYLSVCPCLLCAGASRAVDGSTGGMSACLFSNVAITHCHVVYCFRPCVLSRHCRLSPLYLTVYSCRAECSGLWHTHVSIQVHTRRALRCREGAGVRSHSNPRRFFHLPASHQHTHRRCHLLVLETQREPASPVSRSPMLTRFL